MSDSPEDTSKPDTLSDNDSATAIPLMMNKFIHSDTFDQLFFEGMKLVEDTASYLDGTGRQAARELDHQLALIYSAKSMELTARLMQIASWLVIQKAVREGDMQASEAANKKFRFNPDIKLSCDIHGCESLPQEFLILIDRSTNLYDQINKLDQKLNLKPASEAPNYINSQIETLQIAAKSGTFTP